jgi:hypothetical protein
MTAQHDSLWDRMPQPLRKRFVWLLWFVTWIGLLAGLFNRMFYEYVVIFSAAHALIVFFLVHFRVAVFPAQVRIAYFVWVAIGTYVPYMVILMYITTIGLATNLFCNYCPLARMMYLLPWNREEVFSFGLVVRVFLTPPVMGKFKPCPPVA